MAEKSSSMSIVWLVLALVLGFFALSFLAGLVWTIIKWSLIGIAAVVVIRALFSGDTKGAG